MYLKTMMFEREFCAIVLNFVLITSSPLVAQPMNENAGFKSNQIKSTLFNEGEH